MKKTFDCVEMKHRGAAELRTKLQGLSREQELEFWRQADEKLRQRQEELRQTKSAETKG